MLSFFYYPFIVGLVTFYCLQLADSSWQNYLNYVAICWMANLCGGTLGFAFSSIVPN